MTNTSCDTLFLSSCVKCRCDVWCYSSHLETMRERPRESHRHWSYLFEQLNHFQLPLTSKLLMRKLHPYSFKPLLLGVLLFAIDLNAIWNSLSKRFHVAKEANPFSFSRQALFSHCTFISSSLPQSKHTREGIGSLVIFLCLLFF